MLKNGECPTLQTAVKVSNRKLFKIKVEKLFKGDNFVRLSFDQCLRMADSVLASKKQIFKKNQAFAAGFHYWIHEPQ